MPASCRVPLDPFRVECAGTLLGASGGQPRAAVPFVRSRTTPRSGGLSPGWMQSRPRHLTCPVRQPPCSLRSSLRHLWDVVWKDDAGPRLRTLAPVSAPPPTTGHVPCRRLHTLFGEMPDLGELTPGTPVLRRVAPGASERHLGLTQSGDCGRTAARLVLGLPPGVPRAETSFPPALSFTHSPPLPPVGNGA